MTGQPQQASTLPPALFPSVAMVTDEPAAPEVDETRVEVIDLRTAGGLGVFLRVGSDQRLTRVAPVRDPNQPRFWCLAAFECSSCGIPVTGSAIWAGFWGSPHSALSDLLGAIRADTAAWLAGEQCLSLREKLLAPRPPLALPLARTPRREATERPSEPGIGAAEHAS